MWGEDRNTALSRLISALQRYQVHVFPKFILKKFMNSCENIAWIHMGTNSIKSGNILCFCLECLQPKLFFTKSNCIWSSQTVFDHLLFCTFVSTAEIKWSNETVMVIGFAFRHIFKFLVYDSLRYIHIAVRVTVCRVNCWLGYGLNVIMS